MSEIKSGHAKEYIWKKIPWVYLDCAVKAISIAETEAEQRHAKQLQELRDKAIKLLTKNCDCTAKLFDDNNCEKCYKVHSFTQKLNEQ